MALSGSLVLMLTFNVFVHFKTCGTGHMSNGGNLSCIFSAWKSLCAPYRLLAGASAVQWGQTSIYTE